MLCSIIRCAIVVGSILSKPFKLVKASRLDIDKMPPIAVKLPKAFKLVNESLRLMRKLPPIVVKLSKPLKLARA